MTFNFFLKYNEIQKCFTEGEISGSVEAETEKEAIDIIRNNVDSGYGKLSNISWDSTEFSVETEEILSFLADFDTLQLEVEEE